MAQTRHSQRAKKILAAYDLKPPPKFVELDVRGTPMLLSPPPAFLFLLGLTNRGLWRLLDDGMVIKALLTRLTGQSTVPNVVVRGKSIGGASDIYPLSTEGKLAGILKDAGAISQADGSKFRDDK